MLVASKPCRLQPFGGEGVAPLPLSGHLHAQGHTEQPGSAGGFRRACSPLVRTAHGPSIESKCFKPTQGGVPVRAIGLAVVVITH